MATSPVPSIAEYMYFDDVDYGSSLGKEERRSCRKGSIERQNELVGILVMLGARIQGTEKDRVAAV